MTHIAVSWRVVGHFSICQCVVHNSYFNTTFTTLALGALAFGINANPATNGWTEKAWSQHQGYNLLFIWENWSSKVSKKQKAVLHFMTFMENKLKVWPLYTWHNYYKGSTFSSIIFRSFTRLWKPYFSNTMYSCLTKKGDPPHSKALTTQQMHANP